MEACHNITVEKTENHVTHEYSYNKAMLIGQLMAQINAGVTRNGMPKCVEASFGQQYILQKGLEKFGDRAREGVHKELDQLHKRNCFSPTLPKDMTQEEKDKAQPSLVLVTKKEKDNLVKG